MVVVLMGSVAAGPSNQGSGKETQDGNVAIMWTLLYCQTPTVDWVVPRSIPMTGLCDTFPAIVCSRGNRSQGWFSLLGIVFPLSDTKGFTLVSLSPLPKHLGLNFYSTKSLGLHLDCTKSFCLWEKLV